MKAAVAAAQFESLGKPLSHHRAITRVTMAVVSFTILIAFSSHAPAQAGREQAPAPSEPLLPRSIGVGIDTDAAISIPFEAAMAPESVEAALQVMPAQQVELRWNRTHTRVTISPQHRWRTDERYLVVVSASSTTADGTALAGARRFTFTTESAPAVTEFQVHLADVPATPAPTAPETAISTRSTTLEADPEADAALEAEALPIGQGASIQRPTTTATAVSPSSSIAIGFSAVMDRADVESRFAIVPEVEGNLSWSGENLVFAPTGRLEAGGRYTISVTGAHDANGNALGGQHAFSFIVQAGAQLTKTTPDRGASDVAPATVEMWFSRPMNEEATNDAFKLVDTTTGAAVGGHLTWNEASTRITYTPDRPFAGGRTYAITLGKGAKDLDGNAVLTDWKFTTGAVALAAPARSTTTNRSAPAVAPPAPATTLAGYALNQVNAARAAYGVAPLVLDASVSAVAAAHAWDQARNNYFSHYGLDGSTRETRLARGGVGFGWSGENQCYHVGLSEQATLNWCHAQFMAEPYPGQWNHIANILNPKAHRLGVGIATVGGKTIITWDFAD